MGKRIMWLMSCILVLGVLLVKSPTVQAEENLGQTVFSQDNLFETEAIPCEAIAQDVDPLNEASLISIVKDEHLSEVSSETELIGTLPITISEVEFTQNGSRSSGTEDAVSPESEDNVPPEPEDAVSPESEDNVHSEPEDAVSPNQKTTCIQNQKMSFHLNQKTTCLQNQKMSFHRIRRQRVSRTRRCRFTRIRRQRASRTRRSCFTESEDNVPSELEEIVSPASRDIVSPELEDMFHPNQKTPYLQNQKRQFHLCLKIYFYSPVKKMKMR